MALSALKNIITYPEEQQIVTMLNQISDETFLFFYMFKLSRSMYMYRKFGYPGRIDYSLLQKGGKSQNNNVVGNATHTSYKRDREWGSNSANYPRSIWKLTLYLNRMIWEN